MLIRDLLASTVLEAKMSWSSLRSAASSIDARVGIEFEMYVSDVARFEREAEYEPDYEMDGYISTGTWQAFVRDLKHFFTGAGNSDMSPAEFQTFIETDVRSAYVEWAEGEFRAWAEEVEFSKWWEEKNPSEDEPPRGSRGYERAMEDFHEARFDGWLMEDYRIDDWLEAEGIDRYRTFADRFDLNWPYMRDASYDSGGRPLKEIARSFSHAVGVPCDWSSSYHTKQQSPGRYLMEPDGSLDEPNNGSDAGLEFVSPIFTMEEAVRQLGKVKRWADSTGSYTNGTTGLHINVSLPGYDLSKLDYIKLALFLGDDYVSEQFDRLGSRYAQSAIDDIRSRIVINQNPKTLEGMLDALRRGMMTIASRIIHSGETKKQVTINTKDNRIEFRSPGGDWLEFHYDKIVLAMMRFIVAMDIALDPAKERKEYAKKFYKLLASAIPQSDDTIKYFVQYATGEPGERISATALKELVRDIQQKRYWIVVDGRGVPITGVKPFKANDREHAISIIMPMVRSGELPTTCDVKPAAQAPTPATISTPSATPSAESYYDIIFHPRSGSSRIIHTFTATSPRAAERYAQSWADEHDIYTGYTVQLHRDD